MSGTVGAEVVDGLGCVLRDLGADRTLAVENAERICVKTSAAGVAELLFVSLKIVVECGTVFRTALGTADRVDVKRCVVDADLAKYRVGQGNDLGIGHGGGCAEHFGTELIEFAASARLRLFVSETACQIVEL